MQVTLSKHGNSFGVYCFNEEILKLCLSWPDNIRTLGVIKSETNKISRACFLFSAPLLAYN